ncbi:MAG: von Willebrand factor type A domain-containing protein [Motiliproteus sp.]
MKTQRFTLTPLAIAVSAALLFGCTSDKTAHTPIENSPSSTASPTTLPTTSPTTSKEVSDIRSLIDKTEVGRSKHKANERRERENTLYRHALGKTETVITPTEEYVSKPLVQETIAGRIQAEVRRQASAVVSTDMMVGTTSPAPSSPPRLDYAEQTQDREQYAQFQNNPLKSTAVDPLSTFGVDVDTASYAIARQDLNQGRLPRAESVRTEEWLNYFSYDYPRPDSRKQPFSVYTEAAPSPWADDKHILMVGLKGYEVSKTELPPLNLTFLIDVSGSMSSQNKLPLAKTAMKMLTKQLRPQDRVAIAVYAGAAGLVLESTPGNQKHTIISALDRLHAGGSTAGGAGIQLAYKTARSHREEGAISRVILLSDGDFNVGTTSTDALKKMVEKERQSGVSLSVLTFGRGNIRDELMNSLAEIGNGNAGYIDSAHEAKKYLVDEMSGSLMTIAKDVKSQIEFNPAVVAEYRLLGYETRHLEHHEFNDDKKDAGEIGAGHEVTALYELTLKGSKAALTPQLRYAPSAETSAIRSTFDKQAQELAFLKLRYKQPDGDTSTLITQPIYMDSIQPSYWQASEHFRWSAAVAGAAQKARGMISQWNYSDSVKLAKSAIGDDSHGYRGEFIRLMEMAENLDQPIRISHSSLE